MDGARRCWTTLDCRDKGISHGPLTRQSASGHLTTGQGLTDPGHDNADKSRRYGLGIRLLLQGQMGAMLKVLFFPYTTD